MFKTFIFFIFYLSQIVLAQTVATYGNLLRIRFDQTEIDLSDTLGSWYEMNNTISFVSSSSNYFGVLQTDESTWFQNYHGYQHMPSWSGGGNSLENIFLDSSYTYSSHSSGVLLFYDSYPQVYKTENGYWFLSPELQSAFLKNDDQFYDYNFVQQANSDLCPLFICGKLDSLELAVFSNYSDYSPFRFFIVDLSASPLINVDTSNYVTFSDEINPGQIINFDENIFLVEDFRSNKILLCEYDGQSFTKQGELTSHIPDKWKVINTSVYEYFRNSIIANHIITGSVDSIISNVVSVDRDFKFAGRIYNDSLQIFDVKKNLLINEWDLSSIDQRYTPIIDSPYVYIQQATKYVSVDEPKNIVPEKFELEAYPNPFNPATTINFSLPEFSNVQIKIFNTLGEELEVLINEEKPAGNYNVKFNPQNYLSGIYYCLMKTGQTQRSVKLVLIK